MIVENFILPFFGLNSVEIVVEMHRAKRKTIDSKSNKMTDRPLLLLHVSVH
jgi:hypothetical protein